MKWICKLIVFCLPFTTLLASLPAIVFVHLGGQLPNFVPTAISQARLFNPDHPIFLIANRDALREVPETILNSDVRCVRCEELPSSAIHEQFKRSSQLDRSFRGGFWTYTTERFFYLYDLMKEYQLEELFHLENDVMLYADLGEMLPVFRDCYFGKIAATFDNDNRCIPGFIYVSTQRPLEQLVEFIADRAQNRSQNDMTFLAEFKRSSSSIDSLPIIMPIYAEDHVLRSPDGRNHTQHPEHFFQNADLFASIFDAAALGQYLGGIDPANGPSQPGFVNESCLFQPDCLQFEWLRDAQGRWVPFAIYGGQMWRINNLHIHSKRLWQFDSLKALWE